MNSKLNTGLVFIFILMLLAFNQPLIAIADNMVGNVPGILIYILFCWIALVVVMKLIFSLANKNKSR